MGWGVLRWRISFGEESPPVGFDFEIHEPEFVVRGGSGRELPWSPRSSGGGEAAGDVMVEGLPDAGDLEVEVARLVAGAYEHGSTWVKGHPAKDRGSSGALTGSANAALVTGRAPFRGPLWRLREDEHQGQAH